MPPKPAERDQFDLDFDADDEFTSVSNSKSHWDQPMDRRAPPTRTHEDPLDGLVSGTLEEDPFITAPAAAGLLTADSLDAPTVAMPGPTQKPFVDPPSAKPSPIAPAGDGQATTPLVTASDNTASMTEIGETSAVLGEAVAPKITIHAFCADPRTMDLVRSAAGDRRMERATTVVHSGGLAAAVEYYQNQPTPALVIVEATESVRELLRLLGQLAEVCDAGTKVVVIGVANDIALYRELMRQGVSDYLVPPLKTLQLIGAITSLYADPSTPFIGRQIAFCGAKGGAGASTLAHNVAHGISERMSTGTVIVDLDLAFGTAGLNFNHDPLQGVIDALSHPDRLDPVLMDRMMVKHNDHLSLFAAPATLEQDYDIHPDAFEEVIRKVRAATPYVILDLPHSWSKWKRRMLLTSDDLIIVAEPDLASLRNCKNILDLVRAARPNDLPPKVVVNKVGLPGRPEISLKDFGEALGVTPDLCVPFDAKTFGQAANNGQMLSEVAAKTRAMEAVDQLTGLMLNQRNPVPSAPAKTSILSSLLKRK